jgi:hypothetical protein
MTGERATGTELRDRPDRAAAQIGRSTLSAPNCHEVPPHNFELVSLSREED